MKFFRLTLLTFVIFSFGCVQDQGRSMADTMDKSEAMSTAMQSAVFAGGCFWCTEADFEKVPGVEEAISGYTGGKEPNPTYEEVSAHKTGHVEAVRVEYDPTRVSYAQLVEWFWRHVDPTDPGGQFVDRGAQYRSVIFYANEEQRKIAEASKKRLASSGRFKEPIVTEILPLGEFYVAEDYHQNYYDNNPIRYNWYRHGSGRDQFLEKHWEEDDLKWPAIEKDFPALIPGMAMDSGMGNMNAEDTGMKSDHGMKKEQTYMIPEQEKLREKLTPLQYEVTQKDGTEPAFNNKYWDNKKPGIYVDVVSGEPLFSSTDKYESGTGWPSFTKPLEEDNIVTKEDRSFFMVRTEVRSKHADSHLGHLFEDGPAPTGLRYCMNSAALRFIPKADLEKEGYGEYLELFKD